MLYDIPVDCYNDPADDLVWTTSNFAEVVPGVQTPLSASMWTETVEGSTREMMFRIGVITAAERDGDLPAPLRSPVMRKFNGRVAVQVGIFTVIGDRLPGASGVGAVTAMLGRKPDGMEYHPTRARYPAVALRVPYLAATMTSRIRRSNKATAAWYLRECARIPELPLEHALATFRAAWQRFGQTVALQAMTTLAVIQPLYEAVEALIERTGVGDAGVFSGSGSPEVAGLINSIWKASRGEFDLHEVQRRYGYHGPAEGELQSTTWRENPDPLIALLKRYAQFDDDADPELADEAHRRRRAESTRELLKALPPMKRPAAWAILRLAARRIPLRGAAKESFLMAFDVARAAARRAGVCLAERGDLECPDDVFFLTTDELLGNIPSNARDLVTERRTKRALLQRYPALPSHWTGPPPEVETVDPLAVDDTTIKGIGVSPGVQVGIARVLTTPDFDEVEPGEILVATFTDPGWASVMFISAALVVDIGGALSHAAVVARELGLPCVVNTQNGTRVIRTGDELRVDGAAGTVEITRRAATQEP
jgi:phosphohistidine swiveling domain-containing protein